MSILNNNNKKGDGKKENKNKAAGNASKFLKPNSKGNVVKPVRSTGANRGS